MTAEEIYDDYIAEYGAGPFAKTIESIKLGYTRAVTDFEAASEAESAERAFCKVFAYDLVIKRLLNHDRTELGLSVFSDGLLNKYELGLSQFDFSRLCRVMGLPFRDLEVWYATFKCLHQIDSYTDVSEAWEYDALQVSYALTIGQLSISKNVFDVDMIDYDYDEEPYVSGQEAVEEVGTWTGLVLSADEAFEVVRDVYDELLFVERDSLTPLSLLSDEATQLVKFLKKKLAKN